jgi:hypothetical protein
MNVLSVTLKPRVKTRPRKLIETPASEARQDLLEAVRRTVVEQRETAERSSPVKPFLR